jgi:hypothetical protein
VRWARKTSRCANSSFSICTELDVSGVYMDANRQVQSSRPSHAYSVGGPPRPYAHQINLTLSPSKTGDHSSTQPQHLGPVTILQTLRVARFGARSSRRTRTRLAAATRAGWQIWPNLKRVSQQVLLEALPPCTSNASSGSPFPGPSWGTTKTGRLSTKPSFSDVPDAPHTTMLYCISVVTSRCQQPAPFYHFSGHSHRRFDTRRPGHLYELTD